MLSWRISDGVPHGSPWSYRLGQWLGRFIIFPLLFRMDIQGLEHLPRRGACVLASNHLSNFDPIVMGTYLPRQVTYAAKRELLKIPLLGWAYGQWGVVAVRRDGVDLAALRALLRVLREGRIVAMYPEGTRSRDRILHRPHPGAAYIAIKGGVPVVPVAIWGADRFSWSSRLRHGRLILHLRLGTPFRLDPPAGKLDAKALAASGEVMMKHIAELLPAEYRGPYGRPDAGDASHDG